MCGCECGYVQIEWMNDFIDLFKFEKGFLLIWSRVVRTENEKTNEYSMRSYVFVWSMNFQKTNIHRIL